MNKDETETVIWRMKLDPAIPKGIELEVLGYVPILWSGWESDTGAVLYRILPDGDPALHVFDRVDIEKAELLETLEKRIEVYEQVAAGTRAFLEKAQIELG
jgi:hypothetical protein